ncbi:tRNA(Ile)-lysidine synthase [Haloactinopolyspora alba]|uniref:tRNA(Ile)-lysidine synthase n=1 Tax=Haloactinopolyspora alba TaxID=648780 RepID=A0A2P8EFS9_9ACTN|nr:tRNA lysidine(34) synthetase TilS [Haloactinopolyspora alba]PSL08294.1 tRNA(Ile)-lysidine synthase [Haloactinopolyspora alba]
MAPAHLDVRRAVRAELDDLPRGATVLVACSGGADSLALAAALAWVGRRAGLRTGGVTVDHGLQDGSAHRARAAAAAMARLGLDPVTAVHLRVPAGGPGPEGAARAARYAALDAAAARFGDACVLLGHTRDDQAETVLLGLARGSGARSLAGMAPRTGRYRRPLLGLAREVVRASVPGDLEPWDDPHNREPAYARVRVRDQVLPVLEKELGPGVAAALARSAELLRADADALDAEAELARRASVIDRASYDVAELGRLSAAVRGRVIRSAAIAAGSPPTDLTAGHVRSVEMLVTAWRGQAGIDLPGSVRAVRRDGVLSFASSR